MDIYLMINLPMAHPEMLFSGLWCVLLGVVTGWAMKYATTNAVLLRSIRVCAGALYGPAALGCMVFAFTGRNAVVVVTQVMTLGALVVFVPLVCYTAIRYPRHTKVR